MILAMLRALQAGVQWSFAPCLALATACIAPDLDEPDQANVPGSSDQQPSDNQPSQIDESELIARCGLALGTHCTIGDGDVELFVYYGWQDQGGNHRPELATLVGLTEAAQHIAVRGPNRFPDATDPAIDVTSIPQFDCATDVLSDRQDVWLEGSLPSEVVLHHGYVPNDEQLAMTCEVLALSRP
jgi:hypothetical protein